MPSLKNFLKSELSSYENMAVEWVPGHSPIAYLKDAAGETIKELHLPDQGTPEIANFFNEHGFPLKKIKAKYKSAPDLTTSHGTHHYEYFRSLGTWQEASDFAQSRSHDGKTGYLLTLPSYAKELFIFDWLKSNGISDGVWLGASDAEKEGEWSWVNGPERSIKFWEGVGTQGAGVGGAFNHWRLHEPNNANGAEDEDCAVTSYISGWNDVPCDHRAFLIIEYGDDGINFEESIKHAEL